MGEPEIRPMRPAERARVLDLLESEFGERRLFASYFEADPDFRDEDVRLAADGGDPVSCVQIFSKRVRLRGEAVRLGGIGSVATRADWRKRGVATRLLEDAIEEMRRRGNVLSLLYSGPRALYERLGWIAFPAPLLAVHRPESPVDPPAGVRLREQRDADLASVHALYAHACEEIETSTVRDDAYWEGQLRYAGNPDEDFRVAEREGDVVAYARAVRVYGAHRAMEFAAAEGEIASLTALIAALAPDRGALLVPANAEPALEGALRGAGARIDRIEDPSLMWRVLDRGVLEEIARVEPAMTDADLLARLVAGPRAVYWPSDRF
jgi:predicted N-acetyltransferase YhbS